MRMTPGQKMHSYCWNICRPMCLLCQTVDPSEARVDVFHPVIFIRRVTLFAMPHQDTNWLRPLLLPLWKIVIRACNGWDPLLRNIISPSLLGTVPDLSNEDTFIRHGTAPCSSVSRTLCGPSCSHRRSTPSCAASRVHVACRTSWTRWTDGPCP